MEPTTNNHQSVAPPETDLARLVNAALRGADSAATSAGGGDSAVTPARESDNAVTPVGKPHRAATPVRGADKAATSDEVPDESVAFCLVERGAHARKCPRRLRPKSEVLSPKPQSRSLPRRIADGAVTFFVWVTDPFDFLWEAFDSLMRRMFRRRKTRLRMTQLKGGWRSLAGGLNSALCIAGSKALVVGERSLSVVYAGEQASAVGWQKPLSEVDHVELATWRSADGRGATLRWHFRDGSWADVFAKGPGWRALTEAAPRLRTGA